MARAILIDEGADLTTLDARTSYTLTTEKKLKANGDVEFRDTIIIAAGRVVGSKASVSASIQSLEALVSSGGTVRVRVQADGVDEFDFTKAGSVGGPHVTRVHFPADDGGGEFHQTFEISIFIRRTGTSNPGGGASNNYFLKREIQVIRQDETIIRKIWRITVGSKTLQNAIDFANARKPSVKPLLEDFTRGKDETTVIATWVWDASDGTIVEFTEQNPQVVKGDPLFVEVPLLFPQDPDVHRARRRVHKITIQGLIRAIGKNGPPKIKIPKRHLRPGLKVVAVATDGLTPDEAILTDAVRGIYDFQFQEKYWVLSKTIPKLKHVDHNKPLAGTKAKEPPDGNFFS